MTPTLRKLLRQSAAIAVPCQQELEYFRRLGHDAAPVHVIPPGVAAPEPPSISRSELLAQLNLVPPARLIATSGPLLRRKQIDEAIWCFELVRVLHPEARLIIFGDGPDRARLERFAAAVSDPGCIAFAGYRPDAATLAAHADVFWQLGASTATPYALLESRAAGVPVVASDVAGHRAALAPGQSGHLTPPGSRADVARATDDFFSHPDVARQAAAAAAEMVRSKWSLEAMNSRYDELYARVGKP
jgi:glycosyltransferase involved in cell wall biosynthesis